MKRWRHGWMLLGLAVMLMGPTPGHIGGCNSGADLADAELYCFDKEIALAARAGRTPDGSAIRARCLGRNWPPSCAPTMTEVNGCLAALEDSARVSQPFEALPECNAICAGSRAAPNDAGVPADAGVPRDAAIPGDTGPTAASPDASATARDGGGDASAPGVDAGVG